MTNTTPGNWTFKVAANGDCDIGVPGQTGIFIECFAEIRHPGENAYDEAQANAHLVCAAKPMKELLIRLTSELTTESLPDIISEAKILLESLK